jgi:hypothetical protein
LRARIKGVTGLLAASAVGVGALLAATAASATTTTCNECHHIQNEYAFRGALDAEHAATAVNTPITLWQESASTTDSGADFLVQDVGTVSHSNWSQLNGNFHGDEVVRFECAPYGNTSADTYIGLNGTNVALRADNSNPVWQEWVVAPVNGGSHVAYVDVGETGGDQVDPYLLTDPGDAMTGSLTQQTVAHVAWTQNGTVPTDQAWEEK